MWNALDSVVMQLLDPPQSYKCSVRVAETMSVSLDFEAKPFVSWLWALTSR